MSIPSESEEVRLISSVFSNEKPLIETAIDRLEDKLGPIGWKSPWLLFDRTRYYEREMGWPLHRRFIFFKNLIIFSIELTYIYYKISLHFFKVSTIFENILNLMDRTKI